MSTRAHRGRAVAVAAAALLSTVVGCGRDPQVNDLVLLLGDSLAVSAQDEVANTFVQQDRSNVLVTNARIGYGLCWNTQGRRSYWSQRVPALLHKVDPDVIVVHLGTNDAKGGTCLDRYDEMVDRFMRRLPAGTPVLWATVRPSPVLPGAARVNLALARAQARWDQLEVIDFGRRFSGHPEWIQADDVHLTQAGQHEYGYWISHELNLRFPPDP